jgi:hypothetical protein
LKGIGVINWGWRGIEWFEVKKRGEGTQKKYKKTITANNGSAREEVENEKWYPMN